jgi:small subunit ribosomal protein S9
MKDNFTYAIGRRKTSTATVRLYKGKGESTVNGDKWEQYFPVATLQQRITAPLRKLGLGSDRHFTAVTSGGGVSGQAGAVMLGIARALVEESADNKSPLKQEGLLTRDSRMVERKKTGQPKARKKPQFSKR